jgi:hypothetical protein
VSGGGLDDGVEGRPSVDDTFLMVAGRPNQYLSAFIGPRTHQANPKLKVFSIVANPPVFRTTYQADCADSALVVADQ